MALYRLTVKSSGNTNGVRYEKGMTVEIVSSSSNPIGNEKGKEDASRAFMAKYAIDAVKGYLLSSSKLDWEKIS